MGVKIFRVVKTLLVSVEYTLRVVDSDSMLVILSVLPDDDAVLETVSVVNDVELTSGVEVVVSDP